MFYLQLEGRIQQRMGTLSMTDRVAILFDTIVGRSENYVRRRQGIML